MAQHLFLQCPSCGTENRIPPVRVGQTGRCGRCRSELPGTGYYFSAPVEIPETAFDAVIRLASRPVLIDFRADWCQPCRELAPVLEALASEMAGRLIVGEVDADQAAVTAARFGVEAIPTLVLFRSGIELDRIRGVISLEALRERLGRYLD